MFLLGNSDYCVRAHVFMRTHVLGLQENWDQIQLVQFWHGGVDNSRRVARMKVHIEERTI